jgi:alkane 1-monooxygenase
LVQGYSVVWEYESKRLAKQNKSRFSLENRVISYNICHVLYIIAIYFIFGQLATIFHLATSIFTASDLEVVNYIEHYGILRKKDKNGVYESIDLTHSWNSAHNFSNFLLFKL